MARSNGGQNVNGARNTEALFSGTFQRSFSERVRHLKIESDAWKTMKTREAADYDNEIEEEQRMTMIILDDYDDVSGCDEDRAGYNDEKKTFQEFDKLPGAQSKRDKTPFGSSRRADRQTDRQTDRHGESLRSCSHRRSAGRGLRPVNSQRCENRPPRANRDGYSRPQDTQSIDRFVDDPSQSTPKPGDDICKICFSEEALLSRFCCRFSVCHSCFKTYLQTQIDDGKVEMNCPNYECRSVVPYEEVIRTVDPDMITKLDRFVASALRQKDFKACPQCSAITVASETLLSKAKQEKSRFKVTCPICELEWCYDCETPWHIKTKCEKPKSNDKLFKDWTKRYSGDRKNARKCPKCRVYIQKANGCDSIICRQCKTRFCYRCGRRLDSSAHRCYDFHPKSNRDKGDIFLIVLLAPFAIPAIVIVAAFSLPFLIGYGGYKLVKAVRRRPATH